MVKNQAAEGAIQVKVRIMSRHHDGCTTGIDFLENSENFFSVWRAQSPHAAAHRPKAYRAWQNVSG